MKSYFPYVIGAFGGALIAFLLSNLFGLTGTPQLVAFGFLTWLIELKMARE